MPRTNENEYRRYMKKYMREWRKQQAEKRAELEKAIRQGNVNLAKRILNSKPSISIANRLVKPNTKSMMGIVEKPAKPKTMPKSKRRRRKSGGRKR